MKKLILFFAVIFCMTACQNKAKETVKESEVKTFIYPEGSPVAIHGALHVDGIQLVDKNSQPVQLAGMSTIGWMWCPECYTKESITHLVEKWHCNVIRAAMYVEEGGYNTDPEWNTQMMKNLIEWCGELGVYVVVDWHILTPGDPLAPEYKAAPEFFREIADSYAGADHVIYELCNEPNDRGNPEGVTVDWARITEYATGIIPIIHEAADKAGAQHPIILCGTPRWDQVVNAPIVGGDKRLPYDNILYTFHFYASTHTFYNEIYEVLGQLPVFCSEYGTVEASGNGEANFAATDKWLLMFNGNNAGKQLVSSCNWSFCDKPETSAALYAGACAQQAWDNVQPSGDYVKRFITEMNTGVKDSVVLNPASMYVHK
jgi:hypothetical protein